MHGSKTKSIKWLLLLAVFFIAMSFTARPAFAAPSDFEDLTGEGKSGKVKISVTSYQEKDGDLVRVPELVRIRAGDETSYIPVITNEGSECSLRLRVYAKTENQDINILKYCYGWEDNWIKKDGWFYYRKPFEKNESVEICKGFYFPDEWQWRVCNVMGITVDAEAVADEPENIGIVKTGDETDIELLLLILGASLLIVLITGRKRNADKDI
ncbi:MAG: hypothetical protein Q4B67_09360 [Eubacteriales bacterium]|nr:hypothetical protein [Eubacteriales bacterium]